MFQPVLKRKADKPAKSTRPSKVARVFEDTGIFGRSFLPSGDGRTSGHVGKPSNISQRRTLTGTPQDSTCLTQSTPLGNRTFVSTSEKQANVSNSQLEVSNSTNKVTVSVSELVRNGAMTSISPSRNFPPVRPKANSQLKEAMSDDRSSSDSLPDPSKLVKDILELSEVERHTGIDVQKGALNNSLLYSCVAYPTEPREFGIGVRE